MKPVEVAALELLALERAAAWPPSRLTSAAIVVGMITCSKPRHKSVPTLQYHWELTRGIYVIRLFEKLVVAFSNNVDNCLNHFR